MSDFPSLGDLVKKTGPTPASGSPISVSSDKTQAVLQKKMGEVHLKEKERETMQMAATLGVPHIDLDAFPVSTNALRQISLDQAKQLGIVCFFASQEQIRLGALDPKEEGVDAFIQQLVERTHTQVGLYMISQHSFDHVIDLYRMLPTIAPITKDVMIREEDIKKIQVDVRDFRTLQVALERASTTDSLIVILAAALQLEASDVHVEVEEHKVVVRFRLDGLLHDAAEIPQEAYKKLVSRIKLVSSLKLNITDKPQDGRFTIQIGGAEVDVRVSTVPTIYGESIVMRLLSQTESGFTLESLGLSARDYELLKREIARPNGMIITTGPTGSGKTTTLYASMQLLNRPDVKILTLEDPVEYKMPGINQSQIDVSKGFTFSKGLRAMLRQDPDIAMVGEIRDLETAEIAIQAALTGHLIMSTIHTNSAAGAIPRFLSMGVKPFLLAPALNAIIGQRLVRRLRDDKKVPTTLAPDVEKRVRDVISSMPDDVKKEVEAMPFQFFTAPEYSEEDGSLGYKGRIGIYEIFEVTGEIEQMILSGNISEYDIEKAARAQGMCTMVQDGIRKALQGITSVDEVFRVIE